MPNYSLVTDARYDPFSYDEILKPVQAANTLHRQVESAYADIDEKVGMWEILANEERDPQTYARYKAYIDKLYAARDALNARGLTPQTSATLQKIRGSYGSQIKPIEIAYARKGEIEKRRNEADIKSGNTMVREYDTSELSLDRFLDDSMADAGWEFSGEKLKGMVSDMVKNLRNALTKEDYIDLGIDPGIAGTWQHWEKYGYNMDGILDAIMNSATQGNTRANEILNGMLDQAVASTGVYNIADDARRERCIKELREHGKQAFWEALEKPKIEHVYDHNGGSGKDSNIPDTASPNYLDIVGNNASKMSANRDIVNINGLRSSIGLPVSADDPLHDNLAWRGPQGGVKVTKEVERQSRYANGRRRAPAYPYDVTGDFVPIETMNGELPKLWDENNELKSKEDFVAQGKNEEDKKALSNYYDGKRRRISKYIDLTQEGNKNFYKIGLALMDAEENARKLGSAMAGKSMEIRFSDAKKVLNERVLPLTTLSDKKNTTIQEIDDMDRDSNLKLGKTAKVKDIKNSLKDDEEYPVFGISPSPTQPGVIMKLGGKFYYIPWDKFGSLSNYAQQGYIELDELYKLRQGYKEQYGENEYNSSTFGRNLNIAIAQLETQVQKDNANAVKPSSIQPKNIP